MKVYLGDFEKGTGFFREADGSDTLAGRVVNVGTYNQGHTALKYTDGTDYSAEYTEHVSRLANHPRLNDEDLAVRWNGDKYLIVYDGCSFEQPYSGQPL